MKNYREFLEEFKKVKSEFQDLVKKFPESKCEEIYFDKWSLKDLISHLNGWMMHDIDCLDNLVKNKESYWEPDIDKFNDKSVNERRNKNWNEVYREFLHLIKELTKRYTVLSNKFYEIRIWNDQDETPVKFLEVDIEHWREHMVEIRKILKK